MTRKIVILLFGLFLFNGCSNESPLSPDLNNEEPATTLEKPVRTEFTGRAALDIIDPGEQFVNEKNGALHVHDQMLQGRLLIDGTNRDWAIRLVHKYKIYPKGRGNGRGVVTIVNNDGTWEGHHRIRFDDGIVSGSLKCKLGNKVMKMRFQEIVTDAEYRVITVQGLLKEYQ